MTSNPLGLSSSGPATQGEVRLEKIKDASIRMAISTTQFYREAAAGRIKVVKIGVHSSAVESSQVDAWIKARLNGEIK